MANTLTAAQVTAYAKVRDFKTQFCKAVRLYLKAYSIDVYQPGEGVEKMGRTVTTVDFARGGAVPGRKAPLPLDYGSGTMRHHEYAQFTGILTIKVTAPCENEQQLAAFLESADHARELDQRAATIDALFQEHLQPFSAIAAYLPNLDVQSLVPMDPDERPADEREVNAIQLRWAVRYEIRSNAPDLPTGTAGV